MHLDQFLATVTSDGSSYTTGVGPMEFMVIPVKSNVAYIAKRRAKN